MVTFLVFALGKISGAAIYSSADDNDYDNYSAYQSLDKKVPGSPVYQGLTKGQLNTGKPTPKSKPSVTRPPGERSDDTAEPLYNVLEQPDTEQGTMPEKASKDSDEHTQEPVYNVLDGSDSEENYEAGESLYNVLEEPESMQDQQQPLYNVLESSDAEKSSRQGAQGSCGLSNEPLYNVLEGPDSDEPNKNGVGHDGPIESTSSDGHDNPSYEQSLDFEPNKSGVGCAAPNGSSPSDAHDNPAYEQSLDFDVPYASVQEPGSQRESVYEPLRGPNDHSLYEPLK